MGKQNFDGVNMASFLYKADLDTIIEGPNQAYWISGGRGFGKSAFLRELYENILKENKNCIVKLVEGRRETAETDIVTISNNIKKDRFVAVLIDDIERIVSTKVMLSLKQIENLSSSISNSHYYIVATSQYSQITATNIYEEDMSIIKWFSIKLSPWKPGWNHKINDLIKNFIPKLDQAMIECWSNTIINVTGGHPSLLGPLMILIDNLMKKNEDKESISEFEKRLIGLTKHALPKDFAEDLYFYISEHVSHKGLPKISRAVDIIKEKQPEAYHNLLTLSTCQEADKPFIIRDINLRRQIIEAGLAYPEEIKPSMLRIPGKLVSEVIQGSEEQLVEPATLHLEMERKDVEEGKLWVHTTSKKFPVILTEGSWKLMNILEKNKNRPTPISELVSAMDLESKEAVNSAIQRLRNTLKSANLDNVIMNVRNKGYILSEKPTWTRNLTKRKTQNSM